MITYSESNGLTLGDERLFLLPKDAKVVYEHVQALEATVERLRKERNDAEVRLHVTQHVLEAFYEGPESIQKDLAELRRELAGEYYGDIVCMREPCKIEDGEQPRRRRSKEE